MTPIKYFLLVGSTIYTVDYAGGTTLVAMCPNKTGALWLLSSLCSHHHVSYKEFPSETIAGVTLTEDVVGV